MINVYLAQTLARQAGITDEERIQDLVHHAGVFLMRAHAKLAKAADRDGAIDAAIEIAVQTWKHLPAEDQSPEQFMNELEKAL